MDDSGRQPEVVRRSNHRATVVVVPSPSTPDAVRVLARLSRLMERASGDLSLPHYRVLSAIADGDERATRLAERLALGKPTISSSVDALCRHGLLVREAVAGDQRATALRLTPAGEAVLAKAESAMVERLAILGSQSAEAAAAVAALPALGDAIDTVLHARRRARA
jgi:DNA-binding MarR family transcriptional regulator